MRKNEQRDVQADLQNPLAASSQRIDELETELQRRWDNREEEEAAIRYLPPSASPARGGGASGWPGDRTTRTKYAELHPQPGCASRLRAN